MGVHKNAEHESGYFEDEEEDEEVARRVIYVNSNREVVGDKSDDNLAEISCCEGRIEPQNKSKCERNLTIHVYSLTMINGVTYHRGTHACVNWVSR